MTFFALISCMFLAAALFPFDKQRRAVHARCSWLADAITGPSPFWRLEIGWMENIDRAKTYVIIPNHQSMADIAVMYKHRLRLKRIAKAGLYGVPFVGAFLLLGRHIVISKDRFGRTKRFYAEARRYLKNGMSSLFFP